MTEAELPKGRQTIYERAEVNERVVTELRRLLKGISVEVLGHLEAPALCCSGGTVAIVRVDLDQVARKK
jgi:hypothetical protein